MAVRCQYIILSGMTCMLRVLSAMQHFGDLLTLHHDFHLG